MSDWMLYNTNPNEFWNEDSYRPSTITWTQTWPFIYHLDDLHRMFIYAAFYHMYIVSQNGGNISELLQVEMNIVIYLFVAWYTWCTIL